jgi:hypothetical protein
MYRGCYRACASGDGLCCGSSGGRLATGYGCGAEDQERWFSGETPVIRFVENVDILATLAQSVRAQSGALYCVGFAAESHDLLANAQAKRLRKGCATAGGQHWPCHIWPGRQQPVAAGRAGLAKSCRATTSVF